MMRACWRLSSVAAEISWTSEVLSTSAIGQVDVLSPYSQRSRAASVALPRATRLVTSTDAACLSVPGLLVVCLDSHTDLSRLARLSACAPRRSRRDAPWHQRGLHVGAESSARQNVHQRATRLKPRQPTCWRLLVTDLLTAPSGHRRHQLSAAMPREGSAPT